jgi:hypothetical protein
LVASFLLGALPPVDLRAVCLVRAMFDVQRLVKSELSCSPQCIHASLLV